MVVVTSNRHRYIDKDPDGLLRIVPWSRVTTEFVHCHTFIIRTTVRTYTGTGYESTGFMRRTYLGNRFPSE